LIKSIPGLSEHIADPVAFVPSFASDVDVDLDACAFTAADGFADKMIAANSDD